MKLQTQIPLARATHQLDYNSIVLLLGSCFVENIGKKFDYYKLQSLHNPFGILFHPKAIENVLEKAIEGYVYTENDVFLHNESWHCYDAHSDLSDPSKEKTIQNLNNALRQVQHQLEKTTHIVITLGTAWVYKSMESNSIVANCHKVPQQKFTKELLSIEEITQSLVHISELLLSVVPKAQLIFTVSPVRHLKDGFVENQQSKAHLISAVHRATSKINASYFPSYEIMMDELRDYRFYAGDMVHPSETAITYIWEKFKGVWIKEKSHSTMDEVETVQKGLAHRPFNPNSEKHLQFKRSLQGKIDQLGKTHPFMEFQGP